MNSHNIYTEYNVHIMIRFNVKISIFTNYSHNVYNYNMEQLSEKQSFLKLKIIFSMRCIRLSIVHGVIDDINFTRKMRIF